MAAGDSYAAGGTEGVAQYRLRANLGAVNGSEQKLGYVASDTSTYQDNHDANYVLNASSTDSFESWNHATIVTQDDRNADMVTNMPPYDTFYMWERTA